MRALLPLAALVVTGSAHGYDSAWYQTEVGTEAELDHLITRVESAVPALTPDEQHYVQQEQRFMEDLARKQGGTVTSERVNAFETSKPFYESEVHREMADLRHMLNTVHELRGSDARFAVWASILMQLSHSEPMSNALMGLHRLGVVNKDDVGSPEGVAWLRGSLEGQVQVLWNYWAGWIWHAWVADGVYRATGASKLLKQTTPAEK